MNYFKKLVGENIYLSPRSVEDTEKYTIWLNDFKTTDYIGHSGKLNTIDGERKYLEESALKDGYNFAIVKLENDELLGSCGIEEIDSIHRIATLGIFIGEEKDREKGYGTEVINLLLDYGFNYLNLHNIKLNVFSFNERAINCYKKCGFKEYGRRREAYYLNGKYYDTIEMDILKSEFQNSFIKNKNV